MSPPGSQPQQDDQAEGAWAALRMVLGFIARYAGRYWHLYLLGGLLLLATTWIEVRIPTLIGEIVNELGETEQELDFLGELRARLFKGAGFSELEFVRLMAAELMLWAFLLVGVRTGSRVLIFNRGRDIQYKLGVDLFAHLLGLQRPFYAKRKVGELISIAANDTQAIRLLVGFAGLQVANVAFAVPMHLAQMLRTDWVLTLWCIAPVVVGAIYMRWTVGRFYTLIRESMQKLAALSDRVLESFSGVGTLRAHVAEEAAGVRFEKTNRDYLDLALRTASLRAFSMPVLGFTGYVGAGIVLWAGGQRVLTGALDVGDLVTFMTLLINLVALLMSLAWVLTAVSRGTVSLGRVDTLLKEDAGLPPASVELNLERPPRLELRALSFTHHGRDEPALLDVSAVVEPGHTLGIFGRTGAGKTTLIDLIARLHTPPIGAVLIDGHDARDLDLGSLRAGMAVVPQTPFLFSTTLRENVRLHGERSGHLDSDDAKVSGIRWRLRQDSSTDAGASRSGAKRSLTPSDPELDRVIAAAALEPDIAALPEGLDTVVGERGVMLSGGQRQRSALARAFYRRPPLLLLDDVLSAVDQATETKLVAAIRSLSGEGRPPTTVIVSHRTSVLEHANEILVLDQGAVVERGTHAALIASDGVYAAAHEHQHKEDEGD